jgi:uncharacterized protein
MAKKSQTIGKTLNTLQQQVINRMWFAKLLGQQYKGKRNIYDTLGYPQDSELDFQYYFNRYERQDIAAAIIDRPVETAWDGLVSISSPTDKKENDTLQTTWWKMEKEFGLSFEFSRLDKLVGLGQFAILLFGFADVKEQTDFKKPLTGTPKLLYLNSFAERDIHITEWEVNPANRRYGLPLVYTLDIAHPGQTEAKGSTGQIEVHYSRVMHVCEDSMMSNVLGTPRLKAIINRLIDLEKLLGGDAEMFWKGARPGYFGKVDKDANMSETEWNELTDQFENYEHDLIRFLHAQGMSIESLAQQIADPSNHVDIQIQAICAKTAIPKRIFVGSERGELSSTQDEIQWRTLIKTRQSKFCEPKILNPFIDVCMERGVLPRVEDYIVEWEDLFAPSEKEKAEVGRIRADALDKWSKSSINSDAIPPQLVPKYFLGLNDDQVDEIEQAREQQMEDEETQIREEEEEVVKEEEEVIIEE